MKKILALLLIVMLSFSMFGCKKNTDDTDNPIVEEKEEEQEQNQVDQDEQQDITKEEDIKEPDKEEVPPKENGEKDTLDEYTGISEKDALALVMEKIDAAIYKIKFNNEIKESNGNGYFIYTISDSNGALEQKIAVENQSGELYCYNADKTIKSYSDFKLYDESKDAECDWNGTFLRKDKNGKTNGTLELAQGDINSFEFSIKVGTSKGIEFGIGQITGNTAVFEDEKGFKLKFIMKDNTVLIEESGKNSYVKGSDKFAGEYLIKK